MEDNIAYMDLMGDDPNPTPGPMIEFTFCCTVVSSHLLVS